MSAKSQHNNILLAVAGFIGVVIIVALIGFLALDRDPNVIQGQVEVTEYRVSSKVCVQRWSRPAVLRVQLPPLS